MRRIILATLLGVLALPAAARAETVTEAYRVPTVDGAQVYVEVTRDPAVRAPVILTYSPYNVLGEGEEFGFRRTPPTDPAAIDAARDRIRPCDAGLHTRKGYDTSPDYDAFWLERGYREDARRFAVPALIAHGWQDYNVKQEEGVELFKALDGDPHTWLFMFQGGHGSPPDAAFLPVLGAFFDRVLLGKDTGIEAMPPVMTQGRTAGGARSAPRRSG